MALFYCDDDKTGCFFFCSMGWVMFDQEMKTPEACYPLYTRTHIHFSSAFAFNYPWRAFSRLCQLFSEFAIAQPARDKRLTISIISWWNLKVMNSTRRHEMLQQKNTHPGIDNLEKLCSCSVPALFNTCILLLYRAHEVSSSALVWCL